MVEVEKIEESQGEIVRLGQKFKLIKPDKPLSMFWHPDFSLKLDELDGFLPMFSVCFFGDAYEKAGIHPFDPDRAYRIDNEDFDLIKRAKKYLRALEDATCQRTWGDRLEVIGEKIDSEEALNLLERLRLQLFFPSSFYEGKPREYGEYTLEHGFIKFNEFYPFDTGELPKQKYIKNVQLEVPGGHRIYVPDEMDKLSAIEAKFILLPKE